MTEAGLKDYQLLDIVYFDENVSSEKSKNYLFEMRKIYRNVISFNDYLQLYAYLKYNHVDVLIICGNEFQKTLQYIKESFLTIEYIYQIAIFCPNAQNYSDEASFDNIINFITHSFLRLLTFINQCANKSRIMKCRFTTEWEEIILPDIFDFKLKHYQKYIQEIAKISKNSNDLENFNFAASELISIYRSLQESSQDTSYYLKQIQQLLSSDKISSALGVYKQFFLNKDNYRPFRVLTEETFIYYEAKRRLAQGFKQFLKSYSSSSEESRKFSGNSDYWSLNPAYVFANFIIKIHHQSFHQHSKKVENEKVFSKINLPLEKVHILKLAALKKNILFYPSFFSATTSYELALQNKGNVLVEIKVPYSSSPANDWPINISGLSKFPREKEIYFPFGSRFKILNFKELQKSYYQYSIEIEFIDILISTLFLERKEIFINTFLQTKKEIVKFEKKVLINEAYHFMLDCLIHKMEKFFKLKNICQNDNKRSNFRFSDLSNLNNILVYRKLIQLLSYELKGKNQNSHDENDDQFLDLTFFNSAEAEHIFLFIIHVFNSIYSVQCGLCFGDENCVLTPVEGINVFRGAMLTDSQMEQYLSCKGKTIVSSNIMMGSENENDIQSKLNANTKFKIIIPLQSSIANLPISISGQRTYSHSIPKRILFNLFSKFYVEEVTIDQKDSKKKCEIILKYMGMNFSENQFDTYRLQFQVHSYQVFLSKLLSNQEVTILNLRKNLLLDTYKAVILSSASTISTLKKIDLSFTTLDLMSVSKIIHIINNSNVIESLILCNCNLYLECFPYFLQVKNMNLKTLILENLFIPENIAIRFIADLKGHPALEYLSIKFFFLKCKIFEENCDVFSSLSSLRYLGLGCSSFQGKFLSNFANNFHEAESFQILDLSKSNISSNINFFQPFIYLEEINLAICFLKNNIGIMLGESLQGQSLLLLKNLYLEYNQIENSGIIALSEGIKKHNSLQKLSIYQNPVSFPGVFKILQNRPTSLKTLLLGDEWNMFCHDFSKGTLQTIST